MKCWNVGNTTVRNPNRIKDGLRVFNDYFVGKVWDTNQQVNFYLKLVEKGIIEPKDGKLPSRKSQGIGGRKWVAAFNQLGFARAWQSQGLAKLTPVGEALVRENAEDEIYLRQFLKLQLPSPLEHGTDYEGFSINPLRFTLKVMSKLEKLGQPGLTKEEIALYIITSLRNELSEEAVQNIIKFRNHRDSVIGKVAKTKLFNDYRKELVKSIWSDEFKELRVNFNKFYNEYSADHRYLNTTEGINLLNEIVASGKGPNTKKAVQLKNLILAGINGGLTEKELYLKVEDAKAMIKGASLTDYADSMVRYFSMTGLFSVKRNKFIVRDTKQKLVEYIVNEPIVMIDDDKFLDYFYSPAMPKLPSDNEQFIRENIISLEQKRIELAQKLGKHIEGKIKVPAKANILELKTRQKELEKQYIRVKEELFYYNQPYEIDDIFEHFDQIFGGNILGGDFYRPAYLEWNTWRVFLAIDTLAKHVSESRNFKIDDEIRPVHHAKSGVADMIFEYEDFINVIEVTLHTGERQWVAEGEPVPRHVASVVKNSDKPVYSIFLAPQIHSNTSQTFFNGQYWIDDDLVNLNIIPMTYDQLKLILETFRDYRFHVSKLKQLLEVCIEAKKEAQHGPDWFKKVSILIVEWCQKIGQVC